MSQIKLKHSGGNSVIIAAPDSNPASDRTLKLPSNADGTVLTTTNPKAGNIIQVVSTTKTDTFTTTSNTFTDVTGLSVDITPSSTSSKILVTVNVTGSGKANQSRAPVRLLRDSTLIGNATDVGNRNAAFGVLYSISDDNGISTANIQFLDSPNTTNSVTYKVQIANKNGNSNTIVVNRSYNDSNATTGHRYSSSITAEEVAG